MTVTMKRLGVVVFIFLACLINTTTSAGTILSPKEIQMTNEFTLPIPNENRKISVRFSQPQKTSKKRPQLIIIKKQDLPHCNSISWHMAKTKTKVTAICKM